MNGGILELMAPAAGEITLATLGCVVLLADLFLTDRQRDTTYWLAVASILVTAFAVAFWVPEGEAVVFNGAFVLDPLATTLKLFTCAVVAVV